MNAIETEHEAWRLLYERTGMPNYGMLNFVMYRDLLVPHGLEFQSVPWRTWRGRGYRRMQEGACFDNAARHALAHEGIYYTEGLAFAGLLVVHHAWCVDDDGRVIEPTWRELPRRPKVREWEYFGIPVTDRFLLECAAENKYYGCLFDKRAFYDEFPEHGVQHLTNWPRADKLDGKVGSERR